MRRVVITGLGALTPLGNNVKAYWSSLMEGKSGANLITRFDTTNFKVKFACEIKGYDELNYFDKKEVRQYDRFTQYALISAAEAIEDAHVNFDQLNRKRIGVIWGSGNGGIETFYDQVTAYNLGDGTPRFSPYFVPRMLVDIAAGVISIKYGLQGINFCPVSACASSNTAIIEAFNYIRWNKADMIVAGGSDAPINPSTIGGFSSLKALSTNNDDFLSASRPFDETRDGFVMGEGAGALILEEYEHAIRRGATIYAEVVGGGMSADAHHLTGTHPEGEGAVDGMNLAIEEAGISPENVDLVNMHATSTPLGDTSELIALKRVFGNRNDLTLSATKSMTGHLLGAAGAIEAVATVLSIHKQCAPKIAHTKNIESEFAQSFQFPLDDAVNKKIHYALSNTFGFGGHVASLLLKSFKD